MTGVAGMILMLGTLPILAMSQEIRESANRDRVAIHPAMSFAEIQTKASSSGPGSINDIEFRG